MLQIKNLKKEYRTKGGVITKALDDVSITFPEKGLVFLLGKSGSGKSTLLNVIGGLDKADSGEIIIKGKNSKEFTQSDFDSYRNTYIGFVFQEYNILNEFNIEQNIALALQLQGKKHNKEAVDAILKQVGLEQFGKRKPNTLSGGQKQRVAIARALIKSPEIIMADEPTGALDSNTGKQIFDTLKELSKEKLVIVVSHDRDFAEIYADRIIELADGKIISDTSKELIKTKEMGNIHVVNDHTLAIKDVEKVSKKDIDVILDNLKNQKGEVLITSGDHDLPLVRQAIHLSDDNSSEVFKDTKDVKTKEYDPKQTKFIRSHLPFGRAFKMGASYLKLKPVRLIFTSLLTIISLTLFGVASTLLFFKDSYAYSNALKDVPYNSEVVSKSYAVKVREHRVDESGNDEVRYENDTFYSTAFSKEEITSFNDNSLNLKFAPVMTFRLPESYYSSSSTNYIVVSEPSAIGAANYYQYAANPSGFVSSNKEYIDSVNSLSLQYGEYPAKEDEVAISSYASDYFVKAFGVNSADQLIDETISVSISGNIGSAKVDLTIKGIIKTPDLDSTYNDLKQDTSNSANLRSLKEDFADYMKNDFASFLYVSENFGESFISEIYSPESNTSGNKSISLLLQGIEFSNDSSIEYRDVDENSFYGSVATEKSAGDSVKNMTFYDTKLAQTTYRVPNDDEVYLPYENVNQEISSMYANYISNIMNFVSGIKDGWSDAKNYVPALRSLTTEELEELYNKADGLSKSMYGGGTFDPKKFEQKPVFQELKTFYETNYYEYIGNEYLIQKLDRYFNEYDVFKTQRTSPTDKYPDDILDIKTKYEALKASYPDYDFSEKETFINCLTNDPNPLYFYNALNTLWDLKAEGELEKWGIPSSKIDSLDTLRIKYWDDPRTWLSDEEQEDVKALVDQIYEEHPEVEERYGTPGFEMPRDHTDFTPTLTDRIYYKNYRGEFGQLKVIGFYRAGQNYGWCNFVSDNFVETKAIVMDDKGSDSGITNYTEYVTDYTLPEKAYYSGMITPSGYSQEQVEFMQQEFGNAARLNLTNSVARTVSSSLSLISILKPTFLGIGAALAVFASLMLLNYVSASITTKTKEIGILRAVGARGSDLFKIFFSESGLMSVICLVISIIASVIVVWRINEVFKSGLMKAALLNFGVLNILVIIGGAILITVLGTIVPVIIASKKQPVESIRTL